jgi:hypothetical protein
MDQRWHDYRNARSIAQFASHLGYADVNRSVRVAGRQRIDQVRPVIPVDLDDRLPTLNLVVPGRSALWFVRPTVHTASGWPTEVWTNTGWSPLAARLERTSRMAVTLAR